MYQIKTFWCFLQSQFDRRLKGYMSLAAGAVRVTQQPSQLVMKVLPGRLCSATCWLNVSCLARTGSDPLRERQRPGGTCPWCWRLCVNTDKTGSGYGRLCVNQLLPVLYQYLYKHPVQTCPGPPLSCLLDPSPDLPWTPTLLPA